MEYSLKNKGKQVGLAVISGISLVVILITSRCYYDSQEYLYPQINNTCDTANVTFSLSIKPILSGYCTSCHSSANPSGNVILDTYAGVSAQVTNGHLLSSIKQDGNVPAMPQGGKLDNCSLAIIEKWIKAGAPNN